MGDGPLLALEWAVYSICALTILISCPLLVKAAGFFFRADAVIKEERRRLEGVDDLRRSWPELPEVLVQIPTYNEPNVVERGLRAAAALEWPKARLSIQLLDDSTDETTELGRSVAEALRGEGFRVDVIHRAVREGFKAGALKEGLARSEAPFVAIFDADFVPPTDWLVKCMAVPLNDSGLAFVQSRQAFANRGESWITRGQSIYLDAVWVGHFGAFSPNGRYPFNGTGGLWRARAIVESGNWSGATLSEDFDLTIRVFDQGWRSGGLFSVSAEGELPGTVASWVKQQRRWIIGGAQTLRRNGFGLVNRPAKDPSRATLVLVGLALLTLPTVFVAGSSCMALFVVSGWEMHYVYLGLGTVGFVHVANIVLPGLIAERLAPSRTRPQLIVDLFFALVLLTWLTFHSARYLAIGLLSRRQLEFVRTPKRRQT